MTTQTEAMPDKVKAALKKAGAKDADISNAVGKAMAILSDVVSEGASESAPHGGVAALYEEIAGELAEKAPQDKSAAFAPKAKAVDVDAIKATAQAAELLAAKIEAPEEKREPGSIHNPRTQKARGVMYLAGHVSVDHHAAPMWCVWGPPQGTALMPYQMPSGSGPWFARPCPKRPRHGFVESRECANFEDLLDLWAQVKRADVNGEMLLMGKCTAQISAVANNAGVTWGKGNDGATAGKASSVVIPAPVKADIWRKLVCVKWLQMNDHGKAWGIDDTPYLELVEDKGLSRCVQMRDGPAQTSARDYVPNNDYLVTAVLKLENEPDLLAWEAAVASLKGKAGACVWGAGVPLSSHYAVHAVTNGVAFYAGDNDPDGTVLQPSDGAPAALVDADYQLLAAHLLGWMSKPLVCKSVSGMYCGSAYSTSEHYQTRFQNSALYTAIAVLHSQHMWSGEPHLLSLRGFGAAIFARFFAGSCIGEARHFYHAGPGRFKSRKANIDWDKIGWCTKTMKQQCPQRTSVYTQCFSKAFGEIRQYLKGAHADFRMRGWGHHDSSSDGDMTAEEMETTKCGFGGPKWCIAAETGVKLMDAINAFVLYPCALNWSEVVSTMNVAVNLAHNGGFILDKWLSKKHMDYLAVAPGLGLMNTVAGYVALNGKAEA